MLLPGASRVSDRLLNAAGHGPNGLRIGDNEVRAVRSVLRSPAHLADKHHPVGRSVRPVGRGTPQPFQLSQHWPEGDVLPEEAVPEHPWSLKDRACLVHERPVIADPRPCQHRQRNGNPVAAPLESGEVQGGVV